MKRVLLIVLLLFVMTACFVSCGENGKTPVTPQEEVVQLSEILDLSEYVLVRPDNSKGLKEAAAALKTRIQEVTGVDIKIVSDFGGGQQKEILFGKTSRAESVAAASTLVYDGSFIIRKYGDKIIICGKTEAASIAAADFWLDKMVRDTSICVPENVFIFNPFMKLDSLSVFGTDISEYSVLYLDPLLKEEAERIQELIFHYYTIKPEVTDSEKAGEKYIKLVLSEEKFTSEMKVEDGSVIIAYANSYDRYGYNKLKALMEEASSKLNLTSEHGETVSYEIQCPYTKDELMQLLKNVYDSDSVIHGEETDFGPIDLEENLAAFNELTGQDLALIGIDIRQANLGQLTEDEMRRMLQILIEHASKGGIITASAHFSNPHKLDPNVYDPRGTLGKDDVWAELVTKGTAINESFTKELSYIADFLSVFDKCGIPIIWRPLHEANGDWFWFCMVQPLKGETYVVSEESYKNLWIYIYNYLTVERGLKNLIWEYGPNIGAESDKMVAPLYGYPGDKYVDLVGFDWYTDGDYHKIDETPTYRDLESTGKIVNFNEFGITSAIKAEKPQDQANVFSALSVLSYLESVKKDQKHIAYLLTWTHAHTIGYLGNAKAYMDSPLTLSREDVNKLFKEMREN